MEKAVIALFRDEADAEKAAARLVETGIPAANMSIAAQGSYADPAEAPEEAEPNPDYPTREPAVGEGMVTGAESGALIGGLAGLFAGLGTFIIPGAVPIMAAGPLAVTLGTTLTGAGTGAVAGGLVGGLIGIGIPEDHAHRYAGRIHEGQALVIAHVRQDETAMVAAELRRAGALEVHGGDELRPVASPLEAPPAARYPEPATPHQAHDVPYTHPTAGTTVSGADHASAAPPDIAGAPPTPYAAPKREPLKGNPAVGVAGDGASAGSNASTNITASQPSAPTVSGASADNPLAAQDIYGNTSAGMFRPQWEDPNATSQLPRYERRNAESWRELDEDWDEIEGHRAAEPMGS